ncbi:MAG: hypothetical protein DPW13_16410, partial [Planctomycetes bacterium]|nr:hypothetical protein [Planctomycetota bacterium]
QADRKQHSIPGDGLPDRCNPGRLVLHFRLNQDRMMGGMIRTRLSAEHWQRLLREQQFSGLSVGVRLTNCTCPFDELHVSV